MPPGWSQRFHKDLHLDCAVVSGTKALALDPLGAASCVVFSVSQGACSDWDLGS